MSVPAPALADRYHALDSLRGFAMLLGVALHAGISFMANPVPFWPVRDSEPTPLADVCMLAVHDFRMQTFFLLSGFFGCLLYQRYGLAGMAVHRLRRVGVPFALALVLVVPTVMAAGLLAEIENVRSGPVRGEPTPFRERVAEMVAADPEASSARIAADYFASGDWLGRLPLIHLWFLYYLLIFLAATLLLAPLLGRLTGTRVLGRADDAFRRLIAMRGRVPVLALLTFPLMLPMRWVVDTPTSWRPQWHVLGYYFAFFAFGWMLFRQRDLVHSFGRGWRLNLALANLVVLPVVLGAVATGVQAEKAGADAAARMVGGFAAQALYTWMMVVGLWGAFLHYFSRGRAWVRYLADSAYWCYLMSITPVILLQLLVKDWPLPGALKAALVTAATMTLLLVSYEWCVRYTLLGAVLNGRKYRARAEAEKPAPVEDRAGAETPVRV